MAKSNLLSERTFSVTARRGCRLTWFTPLAFLKESFSSVLDAVHTDTTSSAGDWSGYILQRQGNTVWLIPFSQTNDRTCFTVYTEKPFAHIPYRLLKAEREELVKRFIQWCYS